MTKPQEAYNLIGVTEVLNCGKFVIEVQFYKSHEREGMTYPTVFLGEREYSGKISHRGKIKAKFLSFFFFENLLYARHYYKCLTSI